jgi:threonine dehydratase
VAEPMIEKNEILLASDRISPHLHRTPLLKLSIPGIPKPVSFKLELMQKSGSFKARGAFNNMLSFKVPASGVIAASGGNHGAAVAFAAQQLGHKAETFVPTTASPTKVERLKSYGAEIFQIGTEFAETYPASMDRQKQTGSLAIHAYDSPATLAGQGTVAKEIEEQSSGKVSTVFVAVGGGGLIGGVLSWFQGDVKVVAVEPQSATTLKSALEAGQPIPVPVAGLAADSLGARQIGKLGFEAASKWLNNNLLVSDNDIREAQLFLWDNFRVTAEPGGAAALAPLLSGQYKAAANEEITVIICGGNVDLLSLARHQT